MMTRFLRDERGTTAIEYGLIALLISVAIISGVTLLADSLNTSFSDTSAKVSAAVQ